MSHIALTINDSVALTVGVAVADVSPARFVCSEAVALSGTSCSTAILALKRRRQVHPAPRR
jgi:hypothetical protein